MSALDGVRGEVVLISLRKALTKPFFFSICPINVAMGMFNLTPSTMTPAQSEASAALHALHCVSWGQIPRAVRLRMPALMAQLFPGVSSLDLPVPRTWWEIVTRRKPV